MTDDNILEQFVATLNQLETKKHILDLVFSLYLALVSHVSCHNAVLFSFNIKGIITNNPRHYIYLYQKAGLDCVSNYMKNFLHSFTSTDPYKNSVEQNRLLFKVVIHEALEKYIPKQASDQNIKTYPRITHVINLKIKERKRLYDMNLGRLIAS